MLEGEPKFEPISEQQLAEDLKYKRIEDPEVKDALGSYVDSEQRKLEQLTGNEYAEALVRFTVKLGKIYFEGGYRQEAFEQFNDALILARQYEIPELHNEVSQILYTYEDKSKG